MSRVFFMHSLICFIGAFIRFLFFRIKNLKKVEKENIKFKEIRNYKEKPDVEMLDAILGGVVLGVLLLVVFDFIRW